MSKKLTGLAIIAAALLVAAVGSAVSASVMRVGMMDYEVYPCTYNANAGYYVPWDGNAAGQFWISAPRWEWGGEGVSLCADSDGDWRDNGVREGDPNPDFVDEYRRAQSAVNARRAAFSSSLVRLAEHRALVQRNLVEGTTEEYRAARGACANARNAAKRAAGPDDQEAHDAADEAYNSCMNAAVIDHRAAARAEYAALQARCEDNNDRSTVHGETGYQACLSEGRNGGYRESTVPVEYQRCASYDDPEPDPDSRTGGTYRLCAQVPIVDSEGNPIERDGRVLMQHDTDPDDVRTVLIADETVPEDERVYTLPIPDPELVLNPQPSPSPTAVSTPEPTAQYYVLRDGDGNIVATYNQAYFSGTDCDTLYDYVNEYDSRDEDANVQEWANSQALAEAFDSENGCGEY